MPRTPITTTYTERTKPSTSWNDSHTAPTTTYDNPRYFIDKFLSDTNGNFLLDTNGNFLLGTSGNDVYVPKILTNWS